MVDAREITLEWKVESDKSADQSLHVHATGRDIASKRNNSEGSLNESLTYGL